jgi:hypothetical protein
MKKQYFLIVDVETCLDGVSIFDFGAIIVDRLGNQYEKISVLIDEHQNKPLFHDKTAVSENIFSANNLKMRHEKYNEMLCTGDRMLASINAINKWLDKAIAKYNVNLTLTAYNLAFDMGKCNANGINLAQFTNNFCLWQAAIGNFTTRKSYKTFCLNNHYFSNRTQKTGSITIKTNAEIMTHFLTGEYIYEPHTAIEDIILCEIPILTHVLKCKKWRDNITPFNYRNYQLKNNFIAI